MLKVQTTVLSDKTERPQKVSREIIGSGGYCRTVFAFYSSLADQDAPSDDWPFDLMFRCHCVIAIGRS